MEGSLTPLRRSGLGSKSAEREAGFELVGLCESREC